VYVGLFPRCADGVDCQCRRCACSIRDVGRNIGITTSKSTGGSCCGKKKDVQNEMESDEDSSLELVIEAEVIGGFGVGELAQDYILTKSDQKSTTSGV